MSFPNKPTGTRAKAHQTTSGRSATPQANGTRAKAHQVISGHAPQQRPNGTQAKATQAGGNPALGNLGKKRAIPSKVVGAKELVGQVLQTADGRSFRVTGVDVLLPDTADTYAMKKCYGTASDVTAVARRREPALSRSRALPWERALSAPTTFIGPKSPKPYPKQFDHKTYIGDPIDFAGKHWNGVGAILEGHALTHASKNKINNSFYRGTQQINRIAGRKVVSPARVASGAATVARTITNSRLARFSGKFGGRIGGAGAVLSGSKIIYEANTDNWNAHTFVDGGMLAVTLYGMGVTAVAVAAGVSAPVWVPIAGAVIMVYGILDYAFDVNGMIDQKFGRESKKKK